MKNFASIGCQSRGYLIRYSRYLRCRRCNMSRVCSVCGKGRMSGNQVSHSHRKTRRSWAPNVQKVKVKTTTGGTEEVYVCTRCLRSGKIDRA